MSQEANTGPAKIPEEAISRLRHAADEAARHAYAPYSGLRVGAVLLLEDGATVSGCNIENASYGLTICAERNALFRAVAEHGPQVRVAALLIANLNEVTSPPCGACRQVLGEFVTPGAWVFFPGEHGMETRPFAELFPFGFRIEGR